MIQTPVPLPPLPPTPPFDVWALVPIAGLIVGAFVLKWLFQGPIGEAIAERLRTHRHGRGWGSGWSGPMGLTTGAGADEGRVAALEEQVARMRGELSELAERLDFAERLLTERREHKLGAGS